MNRDFPLVFFILINAERFSSLDQYRPTEEFLTLVKGFVGSDWMLEPGGFWLRVYPKDYEFRLQGWKIHVSGRKNIAFELLRRLLPLLTRSRVAFKLCSDMAMLRLANSKNWFRAGGGKFITIYPTDDMQFLDLIEKCHEISRDLVGPYILSDRPYKSSKVIFYRYGEHKGIPELNPMGERVPTILSPSGEKISDARVPYFRLPYWVSDPFYEGNLPTIAGQKVLLKDGRYQVTSALRYSNNGGIYVAHDTQSNQPVVIREARPWVNELESESDARSQLQKHAHILRKLQHTHLVPMFIDSFDQWEHSFVVEEKIEGVSLWVQMMDLMFNSCSTTCSVFSGAVREIVRNVVVGLEQIHAAGIILRDLTKTNVFVTASPPSYPIRFLDFELAYELGGPEPPVPGRTEGYASPAQIENRLPSYRDDYYSLGALVLDAICVTASGLHLNRSGVLSAMRQTLEDLGMDQIFGDIVEGLTDPTPEYRWDLCRVRDSLDDVQPPLPSRFLDLPPTGEVQRGSATPELTEEIRVTLQATADYISKILDYDNENCICPGSVQSFLTNPASFQYGATGPAYFLLRVKGKVPARLVEWIKSQVKRGPCPVGLYSGICGIAWFFLDAGLPEDAREMLAGSASDGFRHENGLYYGLAGLGLTNLYFWHVTKDRQYLDRALEIADELIKNAQSNAHGTYWASDDGIPLGLSRGASGIAVYLAYMHCVSPNRRLLELAESAMDFESANAIRFDRRVFWHSHLEKPLQAPKLPGTVNGTAGVGTAALRVYLVTGEKKFRALADECAFTVSSRFTNKLWQDYGLAGFGELLLDMYRFLGNENYLNSAYYLSRALLPHRICRQEGVVFPGNDLLRVSCDFGMGTAGIGCFLDRVLKDGTPSRPFFPDELFGRNACGDLGSRKPKRSQ